MKKRIFGFMTMVLLVGGAALCFAAPKAKTPKRGDKSEYQEITLFQLFETEARGGMKEGSRFVTEGYLAPDAKQQGAYGLFYPHGSSDGWLLYDNLATESERTALPGIAKDITKICRVYITYTFAGGKKRFLDSYEPIEFAWTKISLGELKALIGQEFIQERGFVVNGYIQGQMEAGHYAIVSDPKAGVHYGKDVQFRLKNGELTGRFDPSKQYEVKLFSVVGLGNNDYGTVASEMVLYRIEGLLSKEEAAAKLAAEKAAKEQAEAAAKEAAFNPKKLNRSQYRKITVEEFSFDMSAGKLAAGAKVTFSANFIMKPTGTNYNFKDIHMGITLKSDHNFVKDIPESRFTGMMMGSYVPELTKVAVYVTVKRPGQFGECSVDIVEWGNWWE